ncbi:MAG TPA: 50S ribosomal protein L15 [Candidatus Limnocylindrales bacterium]|nr:50S ribosomal protein L15 [Candidatus Limnocylindrales bacterium]
MKLHDLRPADGSRQPRTRVGRGIAAGKGKTAGRGTKGQKARAGGSIPPWFEGGQTPLHMRIPKLRGFKNRFKIEYEVVNVGAIGALAEGGAFELEGGKKPAASAPITVNQDILRAVGLVRTLNKPMKVLGAGDLSVPLFVVADAFSASARAKIEAAGGSVNVLEVPSKATRALGVTPEASGDDTPAAAAPAEAVATSAPSEPKPAKARASGAKASTASAPAESTSSPKASKATPAKAAKASKPSSATGDDSATDGDTAADADETPVAEATGTAEPADSAAPTTETEVEAGTPSGDDA